MTDIPLSAAIGALLIVDILAAIAAGSLREFSFSQLEEVCRAHGREDRFGRILKRYEPARLLSESVFVLATIGLSAILFAWIDWGAPPVGGSGLAWIAYVAEWALLLTGYWGVLIVLPWSIARVGGERFLYFAWPALEVLLLLGAPFLAAAEWIDRVVHRLTGAQEPENGHAATLTEEIRSVVDEGQREGLLESEAGTMIHRVMELQDEDTAAVMTPRTDMVAIPATASLTEARERLLEAGHSRIPVIGESTDDIVGILYAKDLLRCLHEGRTDVSLTEIARDPLYVPETTGIDTLLETFKRERVHLAIVLDEYGGVAGLVTLEDILEEIVGDIVDEYDVAEEIGVRPIGPGITEVDARVHIDDLNEQLALDLPEDGDYDTIGGFVCTELGRVPEPGESFHWKQLRFTVLEADKRKVDRVRVELDESLAATPPETR
ncbi:MAG: hemolysin family protein [Planctomycetaceae bacterium]